MCPTMHLHMRVERSGGPHHAHAGWKCKVASTLQTLMLGGEGRRVPNTCRHAVRFGSTPARSAWVRPSCLPPTPAQCPTLGTSTHAPQPGIPQANAPRKALVGVVEEQWARPHHAHVG